MIAGESANLDDSQQKDPKQRKDDREFNRGNPSLAVSCLRRFSETTRWFHDALLPRPSG
jgi:hypothetical protein